MYAGDYRFYSEEQRNELRDFAYDDLHKAKASGNMDALLLYASVSKNRKQKEGALYESAKAGNDIAAYNYWVIIFRRYRYASREVMDKFSKENIYSEALVFLLRAAYAAFCFYELLLVNKRVLEEYTIELPGIDGCSEKELASACLKYLHSCGKGTL